MSTRSGGYVKEDLALSRESVPHLLVGTFDFSGGQRSPGRVRTHRGRNAYWSPYGRQTFRLPDIRLPPLGPSLETRPRGSSFGCIAGSGSPPIRIRSTPCSENMGCPELATIFGRCTRSATIRSMQISRNSCPLRGFLPPTSTSAPCSGLLSCRNQSGGEASQRVRLFTRPQAVPASESSFRSAGSAIRAACNSHRSHDGTG